MRPSAAVLGSQMLLHGLLVCSVQSSPVIAFSLAKSANEKVPHPPVALAPGPEKNFHYEFIRPLGFGAWKLHSLSARSAFATQSTMGGNPVSSMAFSPCG
eukprot:5132383-Amphidinium_carterae.1